MMVISRHADARVENILVRVQQSPYLNDVEEKAAASGCVASRVPGTARDPEALTRGSFVLSAHVGRLFTTFETPTSRIVTRGSQVKAAEFESGIHG
jgi:hypothetical protein